MAVYADIQQTWREDGSRFAPFHELNATLTFKTKKLIGVDAIRGYKVREEAQLQFQQLRQAILATNELTLESSSHPDPDPSEAVVEIYTFKDLPGAAKIGISFTAMSRGGMIELSCSSPELQKIQMEEIFRR